MVEEVVCRSQSEYHNFLDIGQIKLEVFWINEYQKEDSNKTVGVLVF